MPKIKLISVGKNKEKWLDAALDEYVKRLRPLLKVEWAWVADDTQLHLAVAKEKNVICLDPKGKCLTSEQFASFFQHHLEQGGAQITFVIGGAEGLSDELKRKHPMISLSSLTFTHQMTRLILIEQIYRATEILKGTKYHK